METAEESLERLRGEIADLKASRRRLVLAGESERQSIERELHEGPQQHLVALAVNLQLARELVDSDSAAAADLIDEMGRDVEVALEEAARLAHRIHPPLLEAGGLSDALRAAAASTGVHARITVDPEALAEAENAAVVYHCCLVALARAGRGARAAIDVRVDEGLLAFEVTDDGAAADAHSYEDVRDRVEALGGLLAAGSEPGGLNRMRGAVPLRR